MGKNKTELVKQATTIIKGSNLPNNEKTATISELESKTKKEIQEFIDNNTKSVKNNNEQKPEDVETVKKPKVTHQLKGCTICDYTTSIPRRTVCPAHPKIELIPKTR